VVDLHVHYPMRLLGGVEAPRDVVRGMVRVRGREAGRLRAFVLMLAARIANFRHWDGTWRVDPQLLEQGGVRVACSVLYRPFDEMDLDEDYGAAPEAAYFGHLVELMDATERDVAAHGHVLVRRAADLERARLDGKIAFVHCIEGGFHLGATEAEVAAHVHELAGRGVAYITLAHLFWRRVAACAPAIPFLPDPVYNVLFPQRGDAGLSPLGEAAVRAMYRERVLVDISHMRDDAIDATFALIDRLDREAGADRKAYPVIASHAGYRFGAQKYNLSRRTIERVVERGGVIGLIFAQHQINDGLRKRDTRLLRQSMDVLDRHITEINRIAGSGDHIAIGSDLDGFIKPTLGGIESAADLSPFAQAVRARYPELAERLLSENALRVLGRRFA
jgi:microsomal dipeptidase-like Zn-dependent dipeptidase